MPKAKMPLLINLFAGPSAGKTTAALELTAALKKRGYNVEYVSEFAKELVLENKTDLLQNQEFVTEEQYKRLDRLRNSGVEIIVTDSPILLGKIYGKGTISEEYEKTISEHHNSFESFNLFVKRGETFQTEGRIHNLEQSLEIDNQITSMLRESGIFYGNYHHDEIDKTVDRINTTFKRLYGEKQLAEQGARKNAAKPASDWKQTSIADLEIVRRFEKSTLFRIPAGGDYSGYTIMFPNGLIKKDLNLIYKPDFSFVLKQYDGSGSERAVADEKTLIGEQFETELQKIAAFPKYENTKEYLKNCPPTLRGEKKFVAVKLTWNEKKGKFSKMPINPATGGQAQVNNPETWSTFEEAHAALEQYNIKGGIGYILTGDDNIVGIDLDLDPETHQLTDAGKEILNKLKGKTYIEYSASGAVHIFGFGKKPGEAARGLGDSSLEMYGSSDAGNRSLMLTGKVYGGKPVAICDIQKEIDEVYNAYFKRPESVKTATPERPTTLDERAVLDKLQTASNAAKFNALMAGDTSMHHGDYSQSDLALCTMIAFYTHDRNIIDSIYRRSGLYSAEKANPTTGRLESRSKKWDELHGQRTYGEETIEKAISSCTKQYTAPNTDNVKEPVEPLRILQETDKAVLVKYNDPDDAAKKRAEWLPRTACDFRTDENNKKHVVAVSKRFIDEKRLPRPVAKPRILK